MIENSDFPDLDIYPKSSQYGSHDSKSLIYDNFEFDDYTFINDIENSSISPLSCEYLDDINEYDEALLSKLIEEFNQDPLPDTYDINDIQLDLSAFNNTVISSIPNFPVKSKKRKAITCDNYLQELDIKPKYVKIDFIENLPKKKNCNSDAAFRYRQKQKINKSKTEEELNQSASEMVRAKTEMLEMRNKLNTIKNIVKDMLHDKGVFNSFY